MDESFNHCNKTLDLPVCENGFSCNNDSADMCLPWKKVKRKILICIIFEQNLCTFILSRCAMRNQIVKMRLMKAWTALFHVLTYIVWKINFVRSFLMGMEFVCVKMAIKCKMGLVWTLMNVKFFLLIVLRLLELNFSIVFPVLSPLREPKVLLRARRPDFFLIHSPIHVLNILRIKIRWFERVQKLANLICSVCSLYLTVVPVLFWQITLLRYEMTLK